MEGWSDVFLYQRMPVIARKPPTARREQRRKRGNECSEELQMNLMDTIAQDIAG